MGEERRAGGCACGAVRLMAEGEPRRVGLCHCLDCRKWHGGPFGAFVVFPADKVVITGGELGAWAPSARSRWRFYQACGSPVCAREEGSGEVELFPGSFDGTGLFAPAYEAWTVRREPWLPDLPTVCRRYGRNREGDNRRSDGD